MMKHLLFSFVLLICLLPKSAAQDAYSEQVRRYINKYYPLAIEEQKRAGIPASITIAQGIHETNAGASDLMTKANNHFGIKCKSDWKGDTIIHSDNTPNECFKKYASAEESYKDHSDHLKKNQRYASLFSLSITDYAAWAIGLKTCGYATNQQYSVKLIKLIEDYHLQEYTYMAIDGAPAKNYPAIDNSISTTRGKKTQEPEKTDSLRKIIDSLRLALINKKESDDRNKRSIVNTNSIKKIADSAKNVIKNDNSTGIQEGELSKKNELQASDNNFDSGKTIMINGLKAFYAYKDEMLLKYAVKYKIRYAKLLELNDFNDAPLQANMPVYLEKKLNSGTHSRHTVKENENMQIISQQEGIQLKRLYALNLVAPDEEPVTGTVLELQAQAVTKPSVLSAVQKKKVVTKTGEKETKKQPDNDLISVTHPKPIINDSPKENLVEVVPEIKRKEPAGRKQVLLKEDTATEDLSGLKAELDRVVYADNSKLKNPQKAKQITEAENASTPAKHEVIEPTPKVVKKKEPQKKDYTIKKGDTMSGIAEKFHVTIKQLRAWNNISGNSIRDGKTIRVQ